MATDTLTASEHPPDRTSILDELLTAQQVAELLQLPRSTVEAYARRGVVPSIKLGRHRRFVRSVIERALIELLDPTV